jgi:hypothetical protein
LYHHNIYFIYTLFQEEVPMRPATSTQSEPVLSARAWLLNKHVNEQMFLKENPSW